MPEKLTNEQVDALVAGAWMTNEEDANISFKDGALDPPSPHGYVLLCDIVDALAQEVHTLRKQAQAAAREQSVDQRLNAECEEDTIAFARKCEDPRDGYAGFRDYRLSAEIGRLRGALTAMCGWNCRGCDCEQWALRALAGKPVPPAPIEKAPDA